MLIVSQTLFLFINTRWHQKLRYTVTNSRVSMSLTTKANFFSAEQSHHDKNHKSFDRYLQKTNPAIYFFSQTFLFSF